MATSPLVVKDSCSYRGPKIETRDGVTYVMYTQEAITELQAKFGHRESIEPRKNENSPLNGRQALFYSDR